MSTFHQCALAYDHHFVRPRQGRNAGRGRGCGLLVGLAGRPQPRGCLPSRQQRALVDGQEEPSQFPAARVTCAWSSTHFVDDSIDIDVRRRQEAVVARIIIIIVIIDSIIEEDDDDGGTERAKRRTRCARKQQSRCRDARIDEEQRVLHIFSGHQEEGSAAAMGAA